MNFLLKNKRQKLKRENQVFILKYYHKSNHKNKKLKLSCKKEHNKIGHNKKIYMKDSCPSCKHIIKHNFYSMIVFKNIDHINICK